LNIESVVQIIPYISKIFDKHPHTRRKLFFVDEEFFGNQGETLLEKRVMSLANTLKEYNFEFETSARISQIYDRSKNRDWHVNRLQLLSKLKNVALKRCLFGVESGVDSVLSRFNKNVSAEENTLAIKILSGLGIPFRTTYITYDPLMSMDELIDTYLYQGRRDLLLKKQALSESEIFDLVIHGNIESDMLRGEPLYAMIPYMLVSIECLINSRYAIIAKKHDLLKDENLLMGKHNCDYLDKKIGIMSRFSQMWIDRNFSLDYLLKSLMKIETENNIRSLERLRFSIKDNSYNLLGKFLAYANNDISLLPATLDTKEVEEVGDIIDRKIDFTSALNLIMNLQFERVKNEFIDLMNTIDLNLDMRIMINSVVSEWERGEWELINE